MMRFPRCLPQLTGRTTPPMHGLIWALLGLYLLALPLPAAQAQQVEVKGPLAGAPAVLGLRKYREMRLQIQAHAATTLTDEYSQALFAGGQLIFHPLDWLGIGVWGGYAVTNFDTALTDEITTKAESADGGPTLSLPVAANFPDQVGRLKWMVAPQVSFIPLRGKLGVFESLFIDTDLYLFGGVALVGLEERIDVVDGQCSGASDSDCIATQTRTSRTSIGPTFGVGLSLYMSTATALTLEWRAFPFDWNTSGTDEVGDPRRTGLIDENDRISHFNHMISIGLAFYLPTSVRISGVSDAPRQR